MGCFNTDIFDQIAIDTGGEQQSDLLAYQQRLMNACRNKFRKAITECKIFNMASFGIR